MIKFRSTNWVEILALLVLILGITFTIFSPSKMIFYIIAILSGLISGRLIYKTKNSMPIKYYIIISAYLIGLIIGNIVRVYGKIIWPILLFIIGIIIGYKLHQKDMI